MTEDIVAALKRERYPISHATAYEIETLRSRLAAQDRQNDYNAPETITPGGWLVEWDGGWDWTPTRIAAVAALTEGRRVFDVKAGRFQ